MTNYKLLFIALTLFLVSCGGDEKRFLPITPSERVLHFGTNKAFEIAIYGKAMEPDEETYERFKKLLGKLISDETVIKVIQTASGIEGGGTYCIELYDYRDIEARMKEVYNLLLEVNPKEDTRYDINAIKNCAIFQEIEDKKKANLEKFQQSKLFWESEKAKKGSSYTITHKKSYALIPGEFLTKVDVVNDEVVKRSSYRNGFEEWVETNEKIGSHEHWAKALTMDEIYQDCADVLAMDPKKNQIKFSTIGEQGFIKECWHHPYGCVDDCAEGFFIHEVKF